jgi:hypothetical protein
MAVSHNKRLELEKAIANFKFFEAKFYINQLFIELINSKIEAEELDKIADALISLMSNLTQLRTTRFDSATSLIKNIQDIYKSYQHLAQQTHADGVFYHCKHVVLGLGGIILGAISAVLGAVYGFFAGAINDIMHLRVPIGAFTGAATGALVGGIIGYRAPFKLQDPENRRLAYFVEQISDTLESVWVSLNKDFHQEVEQEIKETYFTDPNTHVFDEAAYQKFLTSDNQSYAIKATNAAFIDKRFKGTTGHHSFIELNIKDRPINIELGPPTEQEAEISQIETRKTTGKNLIDMMVMHRILQQNYNLSPGNLPRFIWRYKAGENDCLTYVDKILESAGEPSTKIQRYTKIDSHLGRFIGSALQFFSPAPKVDPEEKAPSDSIKRVQ